MGIKKIAFYIIFILLSNEILAQSFTEAKQRFQNKEYAFAYEQFRKLSETKIPEQQYAKFYYALSGYYLQYHAASNVILSELENTSSLPQTEIDYWKALNFIGLQQWNDAMMHSLRFQKYTEPQNDSLTKWVISKVNDSDILLQWIQQYPEQIDIVKKWISLEVKKPKEKQDIARIKLYSKQYQIKTGIKSSISNKSFNVAVLLPFMFENLSETEKIMANSYVMDLYQGILLGKKYLDSVGIKINIYPYDTQKNALKTQKILELAELKSMDLIIGPLYPSEIKPVLDFAKKHKIHVINPTSSNAEFTIDNEFAHLFLASQKQMAQKLARYSESHFAENQNFMVFYEQNTKDSLMAKEYTHFLESKGFKCLKLLGIHHTDSRSILDGIAKKYEKTVSKAKADSIFKATGKYPKTRTPDNTKDSVRYVEDIWSIKTGTIGHILIVSNSSLIASSAVSAVQMREDTIPLIGGDWLSFPMITMQQMETQKIHCALPIYFDRTTPQCQKVVKDIGKIYHTISSENHLIGFELIWNFGNLLKFNGKNFHAVYEDYSNGYLTNGYLHGKWNDNESAAMLIIQKGELMNVLK